MFDYMVRLSKDKLVMNSFLLMLDAALLSGFGFIYWKIVTLFLDSYQVGIATTLISSLVYLANLSLLGFDMSLIRFLPNNPKKDQMMTTIIGITTLSSSLAGIIMLVLVNFIAPELGIINNSVLRQIIFISTVVLYCLFLLIDSMFVAKRRPVFKLIKNMIFNLLKIATVVLLNFQGAMGVFFGYFISVLIPIGISLVLLLPKLNLRLDMTHLIKFLTVKKYLAFSFANFLSRNFTFLPSFLMPLIIIKYLSPVQAGYFNLAYMISAILSIIPLQISSSLFAEGSTDEINHQKYIKKSILLYFVLMIPAVALFVIMGKYILLFFGKEYSSNALIVLQLMCLSKIPQGLLTLFFVLFNIQKKMRKVIEINLFTSAIIILLSIASITSYGILGVGYSFLLSPIIVLLLIFWSTKGLRTLW